MSARRLGVFVAVLWIGAAFPDLFATFFGERATNDITFVPAWLKALRDLSTVSIALYLTKRTSMPGLLARVLACGFAAFYLLLGLSRGTEFPVAVRGVLWLVPLVWTSTARDSLALAQFRIGLFISVVPSAIVCSLTLGLFGAGMYYESIGPYWRNPGLFLAPSATAFIASLAYLSIDRQSRAMRSAALTMGILSVSGVFYLNAALLFGRLHRVVYIVLAVGLVYSLWLIGLDGLIDLSGQLDGGPRTGNAISMTLGARVVIFQEAVLNFTALGHYPLGLNVAANNSIELFFPDNSYLAAGYAFGIPGLLGISILMLELARRSGLGPFLLVSITGLFFVWFENTLFSMLVGLMLTLPARRPAKRVFKRHA